MTHKSTQPNWRTVTEIGFLLNPSWHNRAVRLLVGGLMFSLYVWLCAGILNLGVALYKSLSNGWANEAKLVISDVIIMLALLELIRTLQSYLELGRVKLTLILDAVLVVLIGELIGLWYREHTLMEVVLSLVVIVILALLRIVAVKFSPEVAP